MKSCFLIWSLVVAALLVMDAHAQAVLFDFDNAPLSSSLPVDQTASGITAHISATGQGYSLQQASVLGFTPQGFAGRVIYPNSINPADLLIRFDQALTDFSIMYCCQELGCDDAATMRATAYMNGNLVGTNTKTASHPGTWPVDTLRCSVAQGFDSVVIHYASPPPTCKDYGTIFLADNMRVTALVGAAVAVNSLPKAFALEQNYPNPFNPSTTIQYTVGGIRNQASGVGEVKIVIYDLLGEEVATLANGRQVPGTYAVSFDASNLASGVYLCRMSAGNFSAVRKLTILK